MVLNMKVAFITIHVGLNFGSILQTIATSELLKKKGCDSICINYWPPRTTNKRYWQGALKSFSKFLWRALYFPLRVISENRFSHYLAKHCLVSKRLYNDDNYLKELPVADVYMSGSDQIWNYEHNEGIDGHYFFEGVKGRKISLSSSIGLTTVSDEYAAYLKKALKEYTAVSVREESAVDLLHNLGVGAQQLTDPTLALNKSEWFPFSTNRLVKEKYLFVYLPYNTINKSIIYETARKIANNQKLLIVTYSTNIFTDKFADRTIKWCNPGDILSLILYSEYVITNSFHGTAFSINLNKQFWVYMPSNFSTRISSLLRLCNLENRLLEAVIEDGELERNICFDFTNSVLAGERQKTMDFLNKLF